MDRSQQTVAATVERELKYKRTRRQRRPSRTLERRRAKDLARTLVFYGLGLLLAALLSYILIHRSDDRPTGTRDSTVSE